MGCVSLAKDSGPGLHCQWLFLLCAPQVNLELNAVETIPSGPAKEGSRRRLLVGDGAVSGY